MSYSQNDIVIVSSGALLPGAMNTREFFDSLLEGRCQVHDLRDSKDLSYRPQYKLIYDADRKAPDAAYSTMGADIPRQQTRSVIEKHNMDCETSLALHVMAVEAIHQCVEGVLPEDAKARTDLIFGSSDALAGGVGSSLMDVFAEIMKNPAFNQEEKDALNVLIQAERKRFAPEQDRLPPADLCIPSNLSQQILEKFNLQGAAFLIDAACASSFAALYLAKLRLQFGLCDFAVVGGADDCLGSGNKLSGFSKLGVLSETGPLPFDSRSDGTVIGEGAVAFLITTLREAKKRNLPILGVIKSLSGSSDGKPGGLTEPTLAGQVRCYENVYGQERPTMSYIECHGTGTVVGDQIELSSLNQFFHDQEIPIGSVKFNVGHTMIAAGATSLLKAVGILERKMIPPSPYFRKFPLAMDTRLYLNANVQSVSAKEPLNIGISSFGFGGTNFHLWLQEYKADVSETKFVRTPAPKVVLCGQTEASIDQVTELFSATNYNIPPKVWPFIDRAQLLSVLLAEKLFRELSLDPKELDQHCVHVISGAAQPLGLAREMVQRGLYKYAYRLFKQDLPHLEKKLRRIYEQISEDSIELTEQSAIGSINSLIASRVSKAFDFRGLNMTVDGDGSAGIKALETARTILLNSSGAVIVLESFKKFDEQFSYLKTTGMRCYLLASADFAEQNDFPIVAEVEAMTWEKAQHGKH